MWSPGRTIDRYVLEAPLADDPAGAWWRVRHQSLGSTHLLRLSAPEIPSDAFLRSSRIQAKIVHPNLLRATDYFENNGRLCVVTDLVELAPLSERLAKGPLSPTEALKVMKSLAGGMATLHANNFLHLDLQPSRILWCAGNPKISDFRLARSATDPATRGGNPAYLAPELQNGVAGDARADVYALGCIAYELLKGQPPARQLIDLGDFPLSWNNLLDRCLRKEPAGRYPHAGALLRALEELEPKKAEESKAEALKRTEEPKTETPSAEPPRPTPVAVEMEPSHAQISRDRSEPEVTTRWGTVIAIGLLSGLLFTSCLGVTGFSWWYTQEKAPETHAVVAAPAAVPRDTGSLAPAAPAAKPVTRPPNPSKTPTSPSTTPTSTTSPSAAPSPAPPSPSAAPAAPPPAPPEEAPATSASGRTKVVFEGTVVPPTVEVTCRGGFRTRAKVNGQAVEVDGMPLNIDCLMYLKDVVSTPAPIKAGHTYTCKVTGTTTSCR